MSELSSISKERREERLNTKVDNPIDVRKYNAVYGGVIAWGLLLTALLFYAFGTQILQVNIIVLVIVVLVGSIGGAIISDASTNPWVSFLGYNIMVLSMGSFVAGCVANRVRLGYGEVILPAILYTLAATLGMIVAAVIAPKFFEQIGGMLFGATFGFIAAEALTFFITGSWFSSLVGWFGIILMSLYVGYDFHRAQQFPKSVDNAVDSALDMYMDIAGLFLNIMHVLSEAKSNEKK